jgi:hypothetical protein
MANYVNLQPRNLIMLFTAKCMQKRLDKLQWYITFSVERNLICLLFSVRLMLDNNIFFLIVNRPVWVRRIL